MDFEGNNAWFAILMVVHVVGAIVGIGPTYAFGIIGPAAEKAGPNGGVALMEVMAKISRVLVNPVFWITQPLTGVLMIYNRNLDAGFWRQEWLVVSIVLYIAIGVLSYGASQPALRKMIDLAKNGEAGSEAFVALAKRSSSVGPLLGVMGIIIAVLMVWKPGSGCGPSLRC